VYHEDNDQVITYGYVNAFPLVFLCRERMLAGEHHTTLVSGDWRLWSEFRIGEVADGPLSEYDTDKQIEVILPKSLYPQFD
jgi:hypothetical protein